MNERHIDLTEWISLLSFVCLSNNIAKNIDEIIEHRITNKGEGSNSRSNNGKETQTAYTYSYIQWIFKEKSKKKFAIDYIFF